jgi:hypothetical protein
LLCGFIGRAHNEIIGTLALIVFSDTPEMELLWWRGISGAKLARFPKWWKAGFRQTPQAGQTGSAVNSFE